MKYNDLSTSAHSTTKRVGRGIASGKGKTAGRGTKGQGARTGFSKNPGFEGGQNPLMQLLPKLRGFNSSRVRSETIHTGQLEQYASKTVDAALLSENGHISSPYVVVKLLVGKGELTKKVVVKLQAASATAVEVVQKAGGSFEVVPRAMRSQTNKAKSHK
jgi:large subunit ribosomal protein L15